MAHFVFNILILIAEV